MLLGAQCPEMEQRGRCLFGFGAQQALCCVLGPMLLGRELLERSGAATGQDPSIHSSPPHRWPMPPLPWQFDQHEIALGGSSRPP
jgi:hypothetical protein